MNTGIMLKIWERIRTENSREGRRSYCGGNDHITLNVRKNKETMLLAV